jgi:hypothetical protein
MMQFDSSHPMQKVTPAYLVSGSSSSFAHFLRPGEKGPQGAVFFPADLSIPHALSIVICIASDECHRKQCHIDDHKCSILELGDHGMQKSVQWRPDPFQERINPRETNLKSDDSENNVNSLPRYR